MKKELTPTQKKKKYKKIQYACFGGEFLSVITPFVAIGIVNFDKYFIQYDGTKMSIAAILAASVMGLAVWLVSSKKLENSYITLLIGWATMTAIFFLLGEIINDISYIMLFGLIGLLGAFGLDIGSASAKKKAEKIDEAIEEAKKEKLVEDYKEEVAQKKVKVKVKK